MISFNLAMAATLYMVAEFPDYFVAFLVGAAFVWLTGYYNAFRALQEILKKN